MQDYSTIVGIIDMRLRGISYGDCCARYNSTITRIMSRSGILNSGLEDLKAMNPEDVETIFYPPENVRRKDESIMPDYGAIYERITRSGSKANLYFMWLGPRGRWFETSHSDQDFGYESIGFVADFLFF